jgi:hypothetical protein
LGQDVDASGGHRNCARDWRGAKRPRKRRNPRKARFSAQPKMRPNEVLPESHIFVNSFQEEALYQWTQVKYPMLIHKFGEYEILTEIIIKEKQYAIGVQPMLYFCFPVTELQSVVPLIGSIVNQNEAAYFIINKDNISIISLMLKMFGTLSANHNYDIITIIDKIIG